MTTALCLNCGGLKFGAFLECPACGSSPSGDTDLDIAFTDHHLSVETLQNLGSVIRTLRKVEEDSEIVQLAFLYYFSKKCPALLAIEVEPELSEKIETLLKRVKLVEFEIKEPETPSFGRQLDEFLEDYLEKNDEDK
jgi:hypothetical protein